MVDGRLSTSSDEEPLAFTGDTVVSDDEQEAGTRRVDAGVRWAGDAESLSIARERGTEVNKPLVHVYTVRREAQVHQDG